MKLLIGTANVGKFIEMKEALKTMGVELLSPSDVGITESPTETGKSFEENARLKARFYHAASGLPVIADDTGIIVDALKNELGVHTRRWGAGPDATDKEWVDFFLERMSHEKNKNARFMCYLCYIDAEGKEQVFEGSEEGTITETIESDYLLNLPLSGCFKPIGSDRVYHAMTIEEKNSISHRGKAIRKFLESIQSTD